MSDDQLLEEFKLAQKKHYDHTKQSMVWKKIFLLILSWIEKARRIPTAIILMRIDEWPLIKDLNDLAGVIACQYAAIVKTIT
jgi:hypothetical protein